MPPDDRRERPLLNPVLTLRKEPVPGDREGGRPEQEGHRAGSPPRTEASALGAVGGNRGQWHPCRARRAHPISCRDVRGLARPSWTPRPLFTDGRRAQLVAPTRNGYLVEAEVAHLPNLARHIRNASAVDCAGCHLSGARHPCLRCR